MPDIGPDTRNDEDIINAVETVFALRALTQLSDPEGDDWENEYFENPMEDYLMEDQGEATC